jgi:lycopene cyclase domain-containing protein
MKALYLLINLSAVAIPAVYSFHQRLLFYKKFKAAFFAITLTAAFFIVWDVLFTRVGVWGFNPKYVTGIHFLNLPIEEVLFFICIPYACLFTYHCLNILVETTVNPIATNNITLGLLWICLAMGTVFWGNLYSTFTALLLFIVLLFLLIKPTHWLHHFYFSYLVILIPFFLVNGILTGSFIDEPVVWYNNNENMGIRILAIPFEDFFYGMLLLLINVGLFEYGKKKFYTTAKS